MFSVASDHLFMKMECDIFYFEGVGQREMCCGYCRWLLWPI